MGEKNMLVPFVLAVVTRLSAVLLVAAGTGWGQWTAIEETKLTASNAAANDELGWSVALSGDTALVGVHSENNKKGYAEVFVRTGGTWIQQATLLSSDPEFDDHFGEAVALSGDVALIGAYGDDSDRGSAYVFVRTGTTWSEQARLQASDRDPGDQFGMAVALWGDRALIGKPGDDIGPKIGNVTGLAWNSQTGTLFAVDAVADSLAEIDPVTSAATIIGPIGSGKVEGLEFNPLTGTLWGADSVSSLLIDIDPATGSHTPVGSIGYIVKGLAYDPGSGTLFGTGSSGVSIYLLSIDPLTGAATFIGSSAFDVGLAFDSNTGTLYGSWESSLGGSYLGRIDPTNGNWTTIGPLGFDSVKGLAFDPSGNVLYGADATTDQLLTIDTSTGAATPVGTYYYPDAGAAYVFVHDGTTWSEEAKLTAADQTAHDQFGQSVALMGDAAVIGASLDDHAAGTDSGSAYVFVRSGSSWSEQQRLSANDAAAYDRFGCSVAVWGESVLVGAYRDDLAPGASGSFATGPGSAYVFARNGTAWDEQAKLVASDGAAGDSFGWSVAMQGDTAVVGAWTADLQTLVDPGAAYSFVRNGTNWSETARLSSGEADKGDRQGASVAVDGQRFLVGAPWDDQAVPAVNRAGSACLFLVEPAVVSYCTAGTSASGCQVVLTASGVASASAPSGFVVMASGVEGSKDGHFYFGANGRQANSWGNGTSFQCVVPPSKRASTLSGSGSPGQCDGTFAQDLNAYWCSTCPKPSKNPGAGAVVQAQLWYRDPQNTSNQTSSLSDALEFGMAP